MTKCPEREHNQKEVECQQPQQLQGYVGMPKFLTQTTGNGHTKQWNAWMLPTEKPANSGVNTSQKNIVDNFALLTNKNRKQCLAHYDCIT